MCEGVEVASLCSQRRLLGLVCEGRGDCFAALAMTVLARNDWRCVRDDGFGLPLRREGDGFAALAKTNYIRDDVVGVLVHGV